MGLVVLGSEVLVVNVVKTKNRQDIDKDILGGVILSARHRIIDCSLLTMMERAKKELTSVHHYG